MTGDHEEKVILQRNTGDRRQIVGPGAKFRGSTAKPRVIPPPGSKKLCGACHRDKPIEEFGERSYSPDFHDYYCKPCRNKRERQRYAARKKSVQLRRWQRMRGDTLVACVDELLAAVAEARHAGMWRGHEGIRAYKRLGEALEAFHRDGDFNEEAVERAPHRDVAPASDADWDPRRHTSSRHIRELIAASAGDAS